jgi:hypothetical protein
VGLFLCVTQCVWKTTSQRYLALDADGELTLTDSLGKAASFRQTNKTVFTAQVHRLTFRQGRLQIAAQQVLDVWDKDDPRLMVHRATKTPGNSGA